MEAAQLIGQCVLIVEDNPLNMKLFAAMVTAQGYGVLQAPDAQCGIEMAHQHHPDLIIMDVNLPGMSGLEATHFLKDDEDTRDIPIIITSAFGRSGEDHEVVASGCDGFMAKPISVTDFVEIVDSYMMQSVQRRLTIA